MEYKYTMEYDLPIMVTVTLEEVTKLIEMLEPIAADTTNSHRWKASQICRNLKEIRKSSLSSASCQLTYENERLIKSEQ